jgi:hypothetical protein
LPVYSVGLCLMGKGNLEAPYEGISITAADVNEAVSKAKEWVATVEVAENSWLQVLLDGRGVATLKPGSF